MFSGIIQNLGIVRSVVKTGAGSRMVIASDATDLVLGESIAVNGVCLTVADFDQPTSGRTSAPLNQPSAHFFASTETLSLTNLSGLKAGDRVHLERALTLSTRLSGHIVQGHVDGIGQVSNIASTGDSFLIRFSIATSLSRYVVKKGSIAIDGVSLTVNELSAPIATEAWIEVMIIPHTWTHTRFSQLQIGDRVNVETDVLAKHVERLIEARNLHA